MSTDPSDEKYQFPTQLSPKEFYADRAEQDKFHKLLPKHEEHRALQCEVIINEEENHIDNNLQCPLEKPFKCNKCEKSFTRKEHLKRHSYSHNDPLEKPFKCEQCQRCFNRKEHLKRHENSHLGDKPFLCYICKKAFTRREHLRRHSLTHKAEYSWMGGF